MDLATAADRRPAARCARSACSRWSRSSSRSSSPTETPPALHGEGLAVIARARWPSSPGCALALPWARRRRPARGSPASRWSAPRAVALAALQPDSARLRRRLLRGRRRPPRACRGGRRWSICGAHARRRARRARARARRRRGDISGLLFSVLPWFFVMRLLRRAARRPRAAPRRSSRSCEESRAAQAEAAALAERGRVARDMHDVLAHSLSALALQLEGARLLAARPRRRPRGGRRRSSARTTSRPSGLDRGARGDRRAARRRAARPGAAARARRRLRRPLRADRHRRRRASSPPRRGWRSTAPPRRRSPTSRRHSAPTASSCGSPTSRRRHARSTVAGPRRRGARCRRSGAGGGYGLTGMRERAELLGGRLQRRPDRATASASSCGCRRDPRPARRRPARGPRGPRHAARAARRDRARRHRRRRRGGASRSPPQHDPDVVLMDLRMPRWTGSRRSGGSPRSASARARSRSPPTPTTPPCSARCAPARAAT